MEGWGIRLRRYLAIGMAGVVVAGIGLTTTSSPASGFGTVKAPGTGQNAEHEMITRALACNATDGIKKKNCIQRFTLNLLAGSDGTYGAVGAPDWFYDSNPFNPIAGLGPADKHCDNGDFLDGGLVANYPQTQSKANQAIIDCVVQFRQRMDQAVTAAGSLVSPGNKLNWAAVDISKNCGFGYQPNNQGTKCEVLNGLGRALHTAEDFWSHSNWADSANPGIPVGLLNPPGLGRTDIPDLFRYPGSASITVPDGLITGCDDSVHNDADEECGSRVGHSVLSKDQGVIDPKTGKTSNPDPSKPRSTYQNNFQRAVTGARAQVRSVWRDFREAVKTRYGKKRGKLIIRAVQADAPWSACPVRYVDRGAPLFPKALDNGVRTSITLINSTGSPLVCYWTRMDSGHYVTPIKGPIKNGTSQTTVIQPNSPGFPAAVLTKYVVGKSKGKMAKIQVYVNNPLAYATASCAITGKNRALYGCQVETGSYGVVVSAYRK